MINIKFILNDLALKILTLDYFLIKKILKDYTLKYKYDSVLDLGCGTGYITKFFPKSKYLGLDIDKQALNYAKKRNKNYKFIEGNAVFFRTKQKFDLIVIIGVLHHLNDFESNKALTNVSKKLTKRGRVIIIEAVPPINKYNLLSKFLRSLDRGHFIRGFSSYNRMIANKLEVHRKERRKGITFDYAIFLASN